MSEISSIGIISGKYTLHVGQEFGRRAQPPSAPQPGDPAEEPVIIVSFTVGKFPEEGEAQSWGIWIEFSTGARTFYKGAGIEHIPLAAPAPRR